MIKSILKAGFYAVYFPVSFVWRWLDRMASWGETRFWIDGIPDAIFTPATYSSYAGWIHNQGFFCSLMSLYLEKPNPHIFDFGCGMGNLAPVAHHFVKRGGRYLGVDTDHVSIKACLKTHTRLTNCEFYRTRDHNPYYAQKDATPLPANGIDWPIKERSQDLVIAMSVFTHLQETDAIRYLNKIHAVLADDGRAILSFHLVRDFTSASPTHNITLPLTPGWFTSNPACPELAIGLTRDALAKLLGGKFQVLKHIEGSITGGRHPSLQDIFVLQKPPMNGGTPDRA